MIDRSKFFLKYILVCFKIQQKFRNHNNFLTLYKEASMKAITHRHHNEKITRSTLETGRLKSRWWVKKVKVAENHLKHFRTIFWNPA